MNKLKEISFKDRKAIFSRLERIASQANLSKEERARLEEDWKDYNDLFNTVDYAKKEGKAEGLAEGKAEGRAEGRAEEKQENARKMKVLGLSNEMIHQVTGLSVEEIETL